MTICQKKNFILIFFFFFFLQPKSILPKDVSYILSNHQEVLVLRLLREIIFCNRKRGNVHKPKKNKNKYLNNNFN
jgi:hypothetical protein